MLAAAIAAASFAHAEPPKAEAPAPSPYIRSSSRDGYTALEICSREYRRADGSGPSVWLVGVIHIGDKRYYDEVVDLLGRTQVVLYESVLPRGAFGTAGRDDLERQRRTQDAMLFARSLVERFRIKNNRLPAGRDELRAFVVSQDTRLARPFDLAMRDGWGEAVEYREEQGGFVLRSLGSDRAEGGRGTALDLVLSAHPRDLARYEKLAAEKSSEEKRDLYLEMADALDVTLQVRSIDYDRAGWEPADLPMEELLDRLWKRGERSATIEMLSSDSGFQRGLLRFLLSFVSKSTSFKKMVVQALGETGSGRRGRGGLGDVDTRIIIDERNEAVIDHLRMLLASEEAPTSVAIFYGAAHMADFEKTLRAEYGMEPREAVWSTAMSVDEWSVKRIEEQAGKLAKQLADADSAATSDEGAAAKAAALRERLAQLNARAAARRATQSAP
ncbi:MAG: type II secretion system protein GspG [Phycisphaerales bacterium]